ncbi:MAG: serine/threonine-protein kinase [Pirellulales bacterium]
MITDATLCEHSAGAETALAALVDELISRLRAGERIDSQQITADHPQFASRLREILPGLRAVCDLTSRGADIPVCRSGAGPGGETDPNNLLAGVLGDFRILREIGRGGMGIVYEAIQTSLARRVALKVLPLAAMLDPRHLQRFKNEALAAASLDHPNIVEVHAVGCERGVHFYAMRYVEGQTLAAVIEALRLAVGGTPTLDCDDSSPLSFSDVAHQQGADGNGAPTEIQSDDKSPHSIDTVAAALSTLRTTRPGDFYRLVAELGIQAAEALDHAHQMGIVHRDIKPSNLMVECSHLPGAPGRDAARRKISPIGNSMSHHAERDDYTTPKLFITDFGLARIQSDAGMTLTGDLLGTLRCMSPEQAEGRTTILDHRTDIYSLGVTLYEIVTLHPAFPAEDRQTLLRQIANDEPPSPRRLNSNIPADLETILLKAIAKDSRDRYATAHDLAADLRSFISQQPIAARRPSHFDRSRRWIARHAALVSVAFAALGVVAAGGIIATTFTMRAYEAEADAHQLAEENLVLAREAVDDMYSKVATGWLAGETAVSSVQVELLQKALGFYERLANLPAETPAKRHDAGVASERASDIHHFLHDYDAAADTLRQSIDIHETLLKDDPANEKYVQALVTRYRKLGTIEELRSKLADSGAAYQQGWRHLEMLLSQDPDSSELAQERVRYLLLRATLLDRQSDFDGAERLVREARAAMSPLMMRTGGRNSLSLATLELKLVQLKCNRLLARVLRHQERLDEAEKIGTQALRICSSTRSGHFHDAKPLGQLAASLHEELAEIALAAGRAQDAVTHFRQSLAEQQRLLAANMPPVAFLWQNMRGNQSYKNLEAGLFCQYSETQLRLAAALEAAGRYFEAEETLYEAMYASMLNQADVGPQVVLRYQLVLANSSSQLAKLLRDRERVDADQALQLAAIAWQWIEDEFPGEEHDAAKELDRLRRERPDILAEAQKGATSDDEAESVLPRRMQAIACLRAGHWQEAIGPLTFIADWRTRGKAYDWLYIAMAHHHLKHADEARGWYERAVASMQEEQLLDEDVNDLRLRAAELIGD